jgi:hypothetical protein
MTHKNLAPPARCGAAGRAMDDRLGGSINPELNRLAPATQPGSQPLAVYVGRVCVGFIRPRGDTFEALDLDRRSLGLFASRSAAADAVEETRR